MYEEEWGTILALGYHLGKATLMRPLTRHSYATGLCPVLLC